MGFQVANFSFGENIVKNNLEKAKLAESARQANMSAALKAREQNISAEQSEAKIRADVANANAERAQKARQFDKAHAWDDAINQQKVNAEKARIEMFNERMRGYKMAADKDELEFNEMQKKADNQKALMDDSLGMAILAAYEGGGSMSPSQLKLFNEDQKRIAPNTPDWEIFGNTITDPDSGMRYTINKDDPSAMYMGSFVRDKHGELVREENGSPKISMQRIRPDYIATVIGSKYGKSYLESLKRGNVSASPRSSSGSRGGLDFEQTMARDAAKYDSYMLKNAMEMAKQVPGLLQDPKKAAQWVKDYLSEFNGSPVKKDPAPTADSVMNKANAVAEEEQKRAGLTKVDAPVKGAKTPTNGAQNPAQNPAQTPAPAAAQTDGKSESEEDNVEQADQNVATTENSDVNRNERGVQNRSYAGILYPEEFADKKKEFSASDVLKTTTPYDYGTTGMRAKSDEQVQREADEEKPILKRSNGVMRTPEEKKFGEAATAAMTGASMAAGGWIGKLASLGITAKSAKRIADGDGTIEDGVALATALIGAGYSAKAAYNRVKGFGIELNNAAMERAASTARTNNNRTARTMPKPTPEKTVKSTGYSNADETLAYTRIKADKASLDKLASDGYVEKNNWFTSDKLAKGTKSVFDDTVGKMEGSGAKGEFKNAIITVKKDKVGDGKVAPKLSDLDGIWVSKGGKKVNILPDILEQHRKSASAAKRIGNVVGEKIGQHRAKQIYGGGAYGGTGMRGEIVETVISELKRRRGIGKHGDLSQVEVDRIRSRAQSVFDEINRKSGGKDPATMGSDEIQKIIIDNTISPEGKIY